MATRKEKQAKYGKFEFWMGDSSSGRSTGDSDSDSDAPKKVQVIPDNLWDDESKIDLTKCSFCHSNIVNSIKYHCMDCKNKCTLCETCENSDDVTLHDKTHVLMKLR